MGDGAVKVGIPGIFQIELSSADWQSIKERFNKRALLNGPCLILERQTGLALDATLGKQNRTRPHLWSTHAAPWQHWRIQTVEQGLVKIVNDHSKLALTTDPSAKIGNKSWVWLESFKGWDCQLWRLDPTDDRVAFEINSKQGPYALDAGKGDFVEQSQKPIIWSTHGGPCQQWMIARLPLT